MCLYFSDSDMLYAIMHGWEQKIPLRFNPKPLLLWRPLTISATTALVCYAQRKGSRREENCLHHLESRGCLSPRHWCTHWPLPKLLFVNCVIYFFISGWFLVFNRRRFKTSGPQEMSRWIGEFLDVRCQRMTLFWFFMYSKCLVSDNL